MNTKDLLTIKINVNLYNSFLTKLVFNSYEIFRDIGIIKKIKISKDHRYIGIMDNNKKIHIYDNMTRNELRVINYFDVFG